MRHVFLLLTFFLSSFAYASPVSFVFQGQIVKPNGSALEASNVDFRVGVLSTSNSCLLYEETFTLNMSNSEGVFNLSVGNGAATANGNFQNLKEALDNTLSTLTGLSCGNGTAYTPSLADTRRIRLTFDDGSGPVTLSQDHILESIPYAQHADELQGHVPEDFLKTNGSTAGVTQVNLEQVFDGGSNQAELLALIGGSSNQYSPISANGAGSLPSFTSASPPSAPSAGDIWLNSDTGDIIYYNGSTQQVVGANAGTVTSVAAGTGLSGGTITGSGTISLANQGVDTAQLANDAVTTAQILNGTITGDDIAANTIAAETKLTSSCTNNQILQSNGSGNFVCANLPTPPSAPVTSVYGRVGVVTAMSGDYAANQVVNTAAGSVAATNVQAAINELDTEKLALAGGTMTGAIAMGSQKITGLGAPTAGTDAVTKTYVDAQVASAGDDLGDHEADQNLDLANNLLVGNGGTSGVAITSGGNVGIGTTAPESKFHLSNGNLPSDFITFGGTFRTGNGLNKLLMFNHTYWSGSDEEVASIGVETASSEAGSGKGLGNLVFYTGDSGNGDSGSTSTERVRINHLGNVGIGTTNPTSKFHISGTEPNIRFTDTDTGSINQVISGSSVGALTLDADVNGASANSRINFSVDAGMKMTILENGNVGIGTTAPESKFHLSNGNLPSDFITFGGTFRTGNGLNKLLMFNHTYWSGSDEEVASIGVETASSGAGSGKGLGNLVFYTGDSGNGDSGSTSTERVRINHLGNVGIGTASPTQNLDVNGNIKGTQLCIGTDCRSAWPGAGGGGTVTSVAAGTGLSGGTITGSGTISLANQGVDTAQLANDAVTTAKILNGTITGDDIAANTIAAETKLTSSCTNNQILQSNGSGNFVCANLPTPPSAPVTSVYGRVGVVTAMSGDYAANQVVNTAAGSVAATNVQAAINELDTEKLALAGGTMTGAIAMGSQKITGLGAPTAGTDAVTKTYVDAQVASAGDNLGDHEADQNLDLANNLLVGNGGTSGVAITSGGNVGIGTTSPEGRQDIIGASQGDISTHGSEVPAMILQQRTGGPSNDYAAMLEFRSDNGASIWSNGAIVGKAYPSYGGGLSFFTQKTGSNDPPGRRTVGNDLSEVMTLTPEGNVGIGTTAPESGLHVVSTGNLKNDRYSSNTYASEWLMRKARGTSSVPLAVNSGDKLGLMQVGAYNGTEFVSAGWMGFKSDAAIDSNNRVPTSFQVNVQESEGTLITPLMIKNNGNVGIGTTSPTQKLDVNGNIKGTQLCIGTDCRSAWPGAGGGGTVTSVATGTGLSGGTITGSGTISLANQGVDTAQLANDAVTTAQIENATIINADIADNTIVATTKLTSSCTNNQILQSNGSGNFVCANLPTAPSAPVTSVYGRVGVVTAMSGDYAANQVVNTAAGSVAATNVQAAINELDTEKLALAGGTMTGDITMGSNTVTGLRAPTATSDAATKAYVDAAVAGGSSETSALISGWPDAIICKNSTQTYILHSVHAPYSDSLHWYQAINNGNYLRFNTDKTYSGNTSLSGYDCINKPISTLVSEGKAKFFGNDIAAVNSDDDDDTKIMVEKNPDEDKIRFDTAGSERMIIDEVGNVGIGITSPTAKLDVSNLRTDTAIGNYYSLDNLVSINPSSASSTNFYGIRNRVSYFSSESGQTLYGFLNQIYKSGSGNMISSISDTASLNLSGSGNLSNAKVSEAILTHTGSGTISNSDVIYSSYEGTPSAVVTSLDSVHVRVNNNGSLQNWKGINIGAVQGNAPTGSRHPLYIADPGDSYFAGNVGIGTTAPDEKLTVNKGAISFKSDGGVGNNTRAKIEGLYDAGGSNYGGALAFTTTGNANVRSEHLRITKEGNVGIGTTSPTHKLHVNGSVAGVGAYVNLSDRRLKRDFSSIDNSLDKVLKIEGLTFDWKRSENPEMDFPKGRDMGVIAQDVKQVFPEAVVEDKEGTLSVAYSKLIAPIIESIKEFYFEFKTTVAELFESIGENKNRIADLEKENQNLRIESQETKKRLEHLEKIMMNSRLPTSVEEEQAK